MRALLLSVTQPAVISHGSAAVLHGLALLDGAPSQLHVTRTELGSSRREAGVSHHAAELPAAHVTRIDGMDGLALTTPARTAVDLARELPFADGVVVADSALRLDPSADLLPVITFCASWAGARTAGRVVSFADGRAESPGESLTRVLCCEQGLPEPDLQHRLADHGGLIGFADFFWERFRTVGEFDGRLKYDVPADADAARAGEVLWREKRREDRIRDLGLEVVRIVWADLRRPEATAARLRRAFARGVGRASRAR